MQTITCYINAADVVGEFRDEANAKPVSAPTLAVGQQCELVFHLFFGADVEAPLPAEDLAGVAQWYLAFDADYDLTTTPVVVCSDITLATSDASTTLTARLGLTSDAAYEYIGTSKTKTINAEISGYTADGSRVYVLQLEGFTLHNLIYAPTSLFNAPIANLQYLDGYGHCVPLTDAGDALRLATSSVAVSGYSVRLQSANTEVMGAITLVLKVNGVTADTISPTVGAEATVITRTLSAPVSGLITLELTEPLVDSEFENVAIIVTGFRLACVPVGGNVERCVYAKPLLYSAAAGYYYLLDDHYDTLELLYPVTGLTALAVKIRSANSAIVGNIAVELAVGETPVSVVLSCGTEATWQVIALPSATSGTVTLTRTFGTGDTLSDAESQLAAVSAVVEDIIYYWED